MVTDRDEGGSCKRFTDLLRISYGQPPCPKDRFADEKTALRIGLLTVFLICKPFPCRSVADPVKSGHVLGDICWHGIVKDERDATRTSRIDSHDLVQRLKCNLNTDIQIYNWLCISVDIEKIVSYYENALLTITYYKTS